MPLGNIARLHYSTALGLETSPEMSPILEEVAQNIRCTLNSPRAGTNAVLAPVENARERASGTTSLGTVTTHFPGFSNSAAKRVDRPASAGFAAWMLRRSKQKSSRNFLRADTGAIQQAQKQSLLGDVQHNSGVFVDLSLLLCRQLEHHVVHLHCRTPKQFCRDLQFATVRGSSLRASWIVFVGQRRH